MTYRGTRCGLGNHLLRGPPTYVTEKKHIDFVRKTKKEFRPLNAVCPQCLKAVLTAYKIKLRRALMMKKEKSLTVLSPPFQSTTSSVSSTSSDSDISNENSSKISLQNTNAENNGDENVATPSTRYADARLPHIQPIPRRRTFVHANKDIMNIYIADISGG